MKHQKGLKRSKHAWVFCAFAVFAPLCGLGSAAAQSEPQGELLQRTITVDGLERAYSLYVPPKLRSPRLTFVMHGSGSKPEMIRQGMSLEFDLLADRDGSLVVYPNGFEDHWHDCRRDMPYSAHSRDVDDVSFLVTLRDALVAEFGVDPARVFAVGMSNGGHMAYRLAHEAPGAFRAFAVVAASLPTEETFDCRRSNEPASVLIVAGTKDPINPYDGGAVTMFNQGKRGIVLSVRETAAYWAALAGYDSDPDIVSYPNVREDDDSTASSLSWIADGKQSIKVITVEGGGHAVPHPVTKFPPFFGPTNADINGPQEIWSFFDQALD